MGLSSEQVIGDSLECSQERGPEISRIAGEADSQHQQREKAAPLPCPRCDSKNTKFCYYNNYSKLQPRHFCKACRRYWTAGGVLRDVPVGGSRKNKRLKTAHDDDTNSCSSTTIAAGQHQQPPPLLMPLDACPEAILYETLHRTPPQLKLPFAPDCGALNASSYVESTPSTALLLPEYLAWEEEPAGILSYRFEDMFDPFSSSISSSSCSSPLDDCARRDSGLIAVNGGESSWQKGHAGSYLSCWDEVFDIVDLELKLPGSEQKI